MPDDSHWYNWLRRKKVALWLIVITQWLFHRISVFSFLFSEEKIKFKYHTLIVSCKISLQLKFHFYSTFLKKDWWFTFYNHERPMFRSFRNLSIDFTWSQFTRFCTMGAVAFNMLNNGMLIRYHLFLFSINGLKTTLCDCRSIFPVQKTFFFSNSLFTRNSVTFLGIAMFS